MFDGESGMLISNQDCRSAAMLLLTSRRHANGQMQSRSPPMTVPITEQVMDLLQGTDPISNSLHDQRTMLPLGIRPTAAEIAILVPVAGETWWKFLVLITMSIPSCGTISADGTFSTIFDR